MNFYDPEAWEAHEARMAGPEEDDDRACPDCGLPSDISGSRCHECYAADGFDSDEVTVVDDFAAARAAVDDLFHAAEGGEENDMGYHDDKNDEPVNGGPLSMEQQQQIVNDWIDAAPVRELKRIKIRCDSVVDKRRAALEQESKELASWEKPHRETRRDKGTTRAQKPANEVLRDKEGVAV